MDCEHEWDDGTVGAGSRSKDNHNLPTMQTEVTMDRDKRPLTYLCSKCGSWKGQLGLEPTFNLYIEHLCNIFNEVKRILKKSGTCWVNLGDSYYSISGGKFLNDNLGSKDKNKLKRLSKGNELKKGNELEQKNLCNIPARFSIEMQNRGWILRNVIIWHKPNCMPSSVKDRFTVDFEYIFFCVKSKKYYFETQYEEIAESSFNDKRKDKLLVPHKSGKSMDIKLIQRMTKERRLTKQDRVGNPQYTGFNNRCKESQYAMNGTSINSYGRNKRTVWKITTKPFKEDHFAVYPEELCYTPIKAGCPEFVCNKCGKARERILEPTEEYSKFLGRGWHDHLADGKMGMGQQTRGFSNRKGKVEGIERYKIKGYTNCNCNVGFSGGIVLDPFFGSGTTGLVALKQNKRFIGIELNKEYIKIAEARLKPYLEQTKLT